MTENQPRRALLSVFRKDGIADFAGRLAALGFEIISTGGTARHLMDSGIKVTPVEEVTGFPEILHGRVKTLHPLIHAGILFRRRDAAHLAALRQHGIVPIDVVVANLYPFAETAARSQATEDERVEMIDIGGPAMVRAAAKNHASVTVLVDPADYDAVLQEFSASGDTSPASRRRLAARAFRHCAVYDAAVAAWLTESNLEDSPHPVVFNPIFQHAACLRYGENPHQKGSLYRDAHPAAGSVVAASVLQGKQLSFNNYLDLDSAWNLASEFSRPAAVVVKHNNPCGAATASSLCQAYITAREADAVSAFGSIVALNRPVDGDTAAEIARTFIEAVFAPGYHPESLRILSRRKNLRLLDSHGAPPGSGRPPLDFRCISGGLLLQDRDLEPDPLHLTVVTSRSPTDAERAALDFGWKVARYVRSNAIVYARADRTVGIGAGQMSRLDAVRLGAMKAASPVTGSALASDAFFPFRDAVDAAAEKGVTAIIQPGRSIRDEEVIAAANAARMAMVFTGIRHFRH
ncbi:MAG: bifunctional phosphoribosylaminoimidazolecarboxamide formyltransferase/IMP cyclohydrolase [Acidobacteriota bacterium]